MPPFVALRRMRLSYERHRSAFRTPSSRDFYRTLLHTTRERLLNCLYLCFKLRLVNIFADTLQASKQRSNGPILPPPHLSWVPPPEGKQLQVHIDPAIDSKILPMSNALMSKISSVETFTILQQIPLPQPIVRGSHPYSLVAPRPPVSISSIFHSFSSSSIPSIHQRQLIFSTTMVKMTMSGKMLDLKCRTSSYPEEKDTNRLSRVFEFSTTYMDRRAGHSWFSLSLFASAISILKP